jgi:hypothetical protein
MTEKATQEKYDALIEERNGLADALEAAAKTSPKGAAIAKKLLEAMKKCGYVQKTGQNSAQNYRFVTAADIYQAVHAAFTEAGISTATECKVLSEKTMESYITDVKTRQPVFDADGKALVKRANLATVEVKVTLTCVDTGEQAAFTGVGSGWDPNDKALAKAQTMALKYALTSGLLIATGDDPEADDNTDRDSAGPYAAQTRTPQAAAAAAARPAAPRAAAPAPANGPVCSAHGVSMKFIPPGISKKTQKPYNGFWACPERECDQKQSSTVSARPARPEPVQEAPLPPNADVDLPFE